MSGTVSGSTEHVQRRELKGIKSGIENLGYVSSAAGNQHPALSPVGYAWKGSERYAWSDGPYSAVSVKS